jgi:RecA-family ATPase
MSDAAHVAQFPVPNREDARTFLEYLDPDTNEVTFQAFTDSDARKETYERNTRTGAVVDPLAKVVHGTLDRHQATLVDLARRGAGIFVTVNRTTLRGRRNNENITEVRAYYADCDGVSEDEIRVRMLALGLTPHIIVKSSEGKWHLYWCVDGAPLEGFGATQKTLAELFGSDPSVCDLARVMRLPGFPHQKDGSKGEVACLAYTHDRANYSEDEFQRALTTALGSSPRLKRLPIDRASPPITKPRPDLVQGYNEGQRNIECARRAGSCLARGMTEREALDECLRWNEYNRPPLNEAEVQTTVASIARTHARNQPALAEGSTPTIGSPPAKLKIIRGDDLLATPAPPRRWLVERFIPAAEVTMLGGDGGTGKTTLGLQLCAACIGGGDWIGLTVNRCNVLYVSAEDPEDEIHFRLEQITGHLTISTEELRGFKLIDLAGKDATIATFEKNGLIKPTPLFNDINRAAREHNAGCIIFDAVADFFGGNENERREVRAFIGLLRGLAIELNAAVIIIAHPSVDGIKTGRGYSGSTHWNNSVRSRLYFTEPEKEDGAPPIPDLRMIELAKSNRARRGEQINVMWMDGCFVRVTPGAVENLTNAAQAEELFLRLLSKRNKQGMHVSPHRSASYAPTELAKDPGSKGFGKTALERAMHRLLDKGKIRVTSYGPPSRRTQRLEVNTEPKSDGAAGSIQPGAREPGPPAPRRPGGPGGMGG